MVWHTLVLSILDSDLFSYAGFDLQRLEKKFIDIESSGDWYWRSPIGNSRFIFYVIGLLGILKTLAYSVAFVDT